MELRARGIDPDTPAERVTADEWFDAHQDEQVDADRHYEIRDDYELDEVDHGRPDVADTELLDDDRGPVVEPAPTDIRETATPDPTERQDPAQRRRIVPVDETREIIERAQTALAEVTARQDADAARAAREAEETARMENHARYSEADTVDVLADDDGAELSRQL